MNDNGFNRAQRQYDAMLPEEGPEPVICSECNGSGREAEDIENNTPCHVCKGEGEVIPEPEDCDEEIYKLKL